MRWMLVCAGVVCGMAGTAVPGWAQAGGGSGGGGNPSFNLVNRSGQAIEQVYATPTGVDRWGQDRLARNLVPAGTVFPVRLPAGPCVYDVRVVYADGEMEERRRVDTCRVDALGFPAGGAGDGRGPQSATADPSFRLLNRGRSEINEVYVSLVGNDDWGRDRLGDDTVSVGGARVIRLPMGRCNYDIRVVFANGEAVERRRMDLCATRDLPVP